MNTFEVLQREMVARKSEITLNYLPSSNEFVCKILMGDRLKLYHGSTRTGKTVEEAIQNALISWEEKMKPDPRQEVMFK